MKTKWWILIFSAAALLCLLALLLLGGKGAGGRIGDLSDGKLLREIDPAAVSEAYTFTVSSAWGENEIRVEPGKVYIISADCPDGTCLRHSPLPGAATPIVCLPHRLVLRTLDGTGGIDAVSGVAG